MTPPATRISPPAPRPTSPPSMLPPSPPSSALARPQPTAPAATCLQPTAPAASPPRSAAAVTAAVEADSATKRTSPEPTDAERQGTAVGSQSHSLLDVLSDVRPTSDAATLAIPSGGVVTIRESPRKIVSAAWRKPDTDTSAAAPASAVPAITQPSESQPRLSMDDRPHHAKVPLLQHPTKRPSLAPQPPTPPTSTNMFARVIRHLHDTPGATTNVPADLTPSPPVVWTSLSPNGPSGAQTESSLPVIPIRRQLQFSSPNTGEGASDLLRRLPLRAQSSSPAGPRGSLHPATSSEQGPHISPSKRRIQRKVRPCECQRDGSSSNSSHPLPPPPPHLIGCTNNSPSPSDKTLN